MKYRQELENLLEDDRNFIKDNERREDSRRRLVTGVGKNIIKFGILGGLALGTYALHNIYQNNPNSLSQSFYELMVCMTGAYGLLGIRYGMMDDFLESSETIFHKQKTR